jgi:DNA-binding winged helix-turn-helix (wHTH) protein
MTASKPTTSAYEFGRFRLDAAERLLLRDGEPVPLAPKVFDTLVTLVEHGGHLVTKSEMMSKLWPDTFVEEVTLARNISDLRKTLGEVPSEPHYIETIPRHGYRFVAPVRRLTEEAATLLVEKHSQSRTISEEEKTNGQTEGEQFIGSEPSLTMPAGEKATPQLLVEPLSILRLKRPGRAVTLATVLAVTALVASVLLAHRYIVRSGERQRAPISSIAVLPLKNLSDDPALKKAYAESGWKSYWRKELELAEERLRQRQPYVTPAYNIVRICARLGEKPRALGWLEKAYDERSDHLVLLKVDPLFDDLHTDPRFADLLRRVGLTP